MNTAPTTQQRVNELLDHLNSRQHAHLYALIAQPGGLPVLVAQDMGEGLPGYQAAYAKARQMRQGTRVTAYGVGIGTSRWHGTVCLQLVDVSILQADAPPMKGAPC